jgi:hypothetical protein
MDKSFIGIFFLLTIIIGCKKDEIEKKDEIAPTVLIIYPANQTTLSEEITITRDALDNIGIKMVECFIDGNLFSMDSIAPYSFQWNTNAEFEGVHTLYGKAIDLSGNVAQSELLTVTVQHPEIGVPQLYSPRDADYTDSTWVRFCWSKVDKAASYNLQISTDSTFSSNNQNYTSTDTFYNVDISPKFVRYWRIQSVSQYGDKSNWSSNRSFAVPLYLNIDLGDFWAYTIKKSGDGGFIIIGRKRLVPLILLIQKINSIGDIIWQKEFSNYWIINVGTVTNSFSIDGYGNYYISGLYFNDISNFYGFIMKLNKNGTVIWEKEFTDYISCHIQTICAVNSGGIIGWGKLDNSLGWFFSVNENGDISWEHINDYSAPYFSAIQTQDGNYVFLGRDTISKFYQDGSLIWKKSYSQSISFRECKTTTDGGLIAIAENYLYKINSNGIIEWSKKVNNYITDQVSFSLTVTNDNYYLISGSYSGGFYITKTNTLGTEIWTKEFKSGDYDNSYFSSTENSDGNYLILGSLPPALIMLTKDGKITNFE